MTKVVGVRFKDTGKTYFFDPEDLDVHKGDTVIVEIPAQRRVRVE